MERGTLERVTQELKRFKTVAIVGLSKNVGKTTVVNHLLRRLPGACVMTVGRDGEEEDKLFKNPKPPVELPKGRYAFVPSQIPVVGVEILETFESPSGKVSFVRALVDVNVQTVRIGSLEEILMVLEKIKKHVGTILIDGAFDRIGAVSISEAAVLVTGAQIGKDLSEIVERTLKTVRKVLTPVVPLDIVKDFENGGNEVLILENGRVRKTGIIGVAGNEEEILRACKDAELVYLPGAVTEILAERVSIPMVVPSCDRIFSEKGKFFVLKAPRLVGVAVNHSSIRANEVDPGLLIDELKRRLNDGIIVFDVLYDV